MAREDWDIKGINVYSRMNTVTNKYEGYDLYHHDFFEGDIPLEYIYKILNLSKQRFVDMLNESSNSTKHLITSVEEDFRYHEKEYGTPYFIKESVFCGSCSVKVELADFESWLDDNYHLLKYNNINIQKKLDLQTEVDGIIWSQDRTIEQLEFEIARLHYELDHLREEKDTPNNWLVQYPVCAFIKEGHEKGMSRKEIIEALKAKGLTNLQAGGLTKENFSYQSDEAMKKAIQRM